MAACRWLYWIGSTGTATVVHPQGTYVVSRHSLRAPQSYGCLQLVPHFPRFSRKHAAGREAIGSRGMRGEIGKNSLSDLHFARQFVHLLIGGCQSD